jgi:histidyl-tRNA synthetase
MPNRRYNAPRGTADIRPEDQKYWRYVSERAFKLCELWGYKRLDNPVFEDADLFVRSIGEGTDIVEKETYTFQDKGGGFLTLRPEGTAPVCRAYLEHGMFNLPQPVRLYYYAPCFRYERPQSGRYRQFQQFGIEALGDGSPEVDAEVVAFSWAFINTLGLKGFVIHINSIGDHNCRPGYIEKLKEYYGQHIASLCDDCKARLQRAPLRLLDCKRDSCRDFVGGAPRSVDSLCPECRQHWDKFLAYLEALAMPYEINPHLVRGLDYYTRTVFEILPQGGGAQSTVLGGGRYDGLIEELGGQPTPGTGFASGIERLVLNIKEQGIPVPDDPHPVVIAHMGDEALKQAMLLVQRLTQEGIATLVAPSTRSLRAQMRYASASDARYVVILGEDEMRKGTATVRDMSAGEQHEVPLAQLASHLKR